MRKLFIFLMLLVIFNACCHAQILEIKKSGEKSFKLVVENEELAVKVKKDMADKITYIREERKKDRQGFYWLSTFFFKNEFENDVRTYVKGLK